MPLRRAFEPEDHPGGGRHARGQRREADRAVCGDAGPGPSAAGRPRTPAREYGGGRTGRRTDRGRERKRHPLSDRGVRAPFQHPADRDRPERRAAPAAHPAAGLQRDAVAQPPGCGGAHHPGREQAGSLPRTGTDGLQPEADRAGPRAEPGAAHGGDGAWRALRPPGLYQHEHRHGLSARGARHLDRNLTPRLQPLLGHRGGVPLQLLLCPAALHAQRL